MTYFGGHGHRPRLAAIGIVFSGIASLLIVIPHFVYGQFATITNGKPIRPEQMAPVRVFHVLISCDIIISGINFDWIWLNIVLIVTRNLDVCSTASESVVPTADPDEECTVYQSIGKLISSLKTVEFALCQPSALLPNRSNGLHLYVTIRFWYRYDSLFHSRHYISRR